MLHILFDMPQKGRRVLLRSGQMGVNVKKAFHIS